MKKIILLVLTVSLLLSLSACKNNPNPSTEDNPKEVIGYAIIPHADGDEHIDICGYYWSNGSIAAYTIDGRTFISPRIILVIE